MHTIMILGGGLVLLIACLAVSHQFSNGGIATGAKVFVPLWLLAASINMWIGVTKAGYTVSQEFPIFLLVFAVPAVIAYLALRIWGQR